MRNPLFIAIIILSYCPKNTSQNMIPEPLPISIPDDEIPPLQDLVNDRFQQQFEKSITCNPVWSRLIRQKKMAVGLVDLTNTAKIQFVRLNGDVMLYAASLPKLAVLLAAVDAIENGRLEQTPEIRHDLRQMIAKSDNEASARLIDRLGFKYIEEVLRSPKYDLYNPKRGGGLWVGKTYARDGNRYPDPLMGISHGATVTQVCRFYYLLAMGKLVTRERSIQMLKILSDPEIHHKFVHTYDEIAPGITLYRKSGTWKRWHSDSVLIWGPGWHRYIIVALVEDPNGEMILRNLIPTVESLMQLEYKLKIGNQSVAPEIVQHPEG